jgi:hypothetical protein
VKVQKPSMTHHLLDCVPRRFSFQPPKPRELASLITDLLRVRRRQACFREPEPQSRRRRAEETISCV